MFIVLSFLLTGTQGWAAWQTVPDEEEKQERMYQYLKPLTDQMNDPMLKKSNGIVYKGGADNPFRSDDLPDYYTYPNGKYEPVRYLERNSDGSPRAYSWWNGGYQLYQWMLDYYTWGIFPFVIDETAFRDAHGTKARPQGRITISVTSDRIIFKIYYDFQIAPEPGGRGTYNDPMLLNIGDPFKKHLGCRQGGTKSFKVNFSLDGYAFKHEVPGKSVCDKHYIKFIDLGYSQTRQRNGRYKVSGLRGDEDLEFALKNGTFQSCWFVAHWETATFMLSDVAKACGMTREQLDDAMLTGGFDSFWLAGSAIPVSYLMAMSVMKKRGIKMADLERHHQQYIHLLAEKQQMREEHLRRQNEIRQRREAFKRDSLAEESAYYDELFKAFPKIKKPYLALKQKADMLSKEAEKKLLSEMEPHIKQLLIKYKGDNEDEGYKAELAELQAEYNQKAALMAKDIEAEIAPEKLKYEKASAKIKEDIRAFRENYKRQHPHFRKAMEAE